MSDQEIRRHKQKAFENNDAGSSGVLIQRELNELKQPFMIDVGSSGGSEAVDFSALKSFGLPEDFACLEMPPEIKVRYLKEAGKKNDCRNIYIEGFIEEAGTRKRLSLDFLCSRHFCK